jgi:hypothetical protein
LIIQRRFLVAGGGFFSFENYLIFNTNLNGRFLFNLCEFLIRGDFSVHHSKDRKNSKDIKDRKDSKDRKDRKYQLPIATLYPLKDILGYYIVNIKL